MRGRRKVEVRNSKPPVDDAPRGRKADAQARREFVARERKASGGSPWRHYQSLNAMAERDGPAGN